MAPLAQSLQVISPMKPNPNIVRFRRRAQKRGLTTIIPRFLDTAKLTMMTAFLLAGTKLLDLSISQRGLVASALQDAITASASACAGLPTTGSYDGVNAFAAVGPSVNTDLVGLERGLLPPTDVIGVPQMQAFPYAQMPIRGMTARGSSARIQAEDQPGGGALPMLHTATGSRALTCQDLPQGQPTSDLRIKTISHEINARAFAVGAW